MKVFTKTVSLTKAQIDALFSGGNPIPLNIIPAPGANKGIVLISANMFKTNGGAASVGTSKINFSFGTLTDAVAEFTGVNAATGALRIAGQNRVQPAIPVSNAVENLNLPLNISASAAISCAANTTAKVVVNFMIVDM